MLLCIGAAASRAPLGLYFDKQFKKYEVLIFTTNDLLLYHKQNADGCWLSRFIFVVSFFMQFRDDSTGSTPYLEA